MPHKTEEARQVYAANYYKKHIKKIKKRAKDWLSNNPERHRETADKWREANFETQLYSRAKASAKPRQLEFNIEISDVVIPEFCPYLGIKLTRHVNGGRQESNASLDRIDNTKGYIKGNVQVISSKANFMKRNASIEELKTFARSILSMY